MSDDVYEPLSGDVFQTNERHNFILFCENSHNLGFIF